MTQLKFKFLSKNYSYNQFLDYMEMNVPHVKKSYKIFETLKPYIMEEMKYRLDYPETEDLSVDQCIEHLCILFRGYKYEPSYRHFILKDTSESWRDQRTVGFMGRVMLRLSKLVY